MGGLSLVSSLSGIILGSNSTHGKIDIIFAGYDPDTEDVNIICLKDIPYSVKIREKGEGYFELIFEIKSPSSRRSYVVRTLFKSDENYDYYDALGSVVALTDEKGKVVAEYDYSPFGRIIDWQGGESLRNQFTYTGREYDRDSGLYYYRARYYDSRGGRFTVVDPILRQATKGGWSMQYVSRGGGCPTSGASTSYSPVVPVPVTGGVRLSALSHAYVYVANNPINYTDPLGLQTCWPWGRERCVGGEVLSTGEWVYVGYDVGYAGFPPYYGAPEDAICIFRRPIEVRFPIQICRVLCWRPTGRTATRSGTETRNEATGTSARTGEQARRVCESLVAAGFKPPADVAVSPDATAELRESCP